MASKQNTSAIRVSVSEAAKLFGVSTQTVRRALRANEIDYIVVSGRYKIAFDSLVHWSQQKTTIKNKLRRQGIGQFVDRWRPARAFSLTEAPATLSTQAQ